MRQTDEFTEPFRAWAKDLNLRLRLDDDGLPIIPSSSRKWKDHLFDGFKNGDIGLSICRDTPKKTGNVVRRLAKKGLVPYRQGHWEALFRLSPSNLHLLASFGFKKRLGPSNPCFTVKGEK